MKITINTVSTIILGLIALIPCHLKASTKEPADQLQATDECSSNKHSTIGSNFSGIFYAENLHEPEQPKTPQSTEELELFGQKIDQIVKDGNYNRILVKFTKEEINVLAAKGQININLNFHKRTPLHMAMALGNIDEVKTLINLKADLNPQDYSGDTPLALASSNDGCANKLQVLIQAGALMNKSNEDGNTPLHIAAKNLCLENCKLLCAYGADKTIQNVQNKTPRDLARRAYKEQNSLLTDKLKNQQLSAAEYDKKTNALIATYWPLRELLPDSKPAPVLQPEGNQ